MDHTEKITHQLHSGNDEEQKHSKKKHHHRHADSLHVHLRGKVEIICTATLSSDRALRSEICPLLGITFLLDVNPPRASGAGPIFSHHTPLDSHVVPDILNHDRERFTLLAGRLKPVGR